MKRPFTTLVAALTCLPILAPMSANATPSPSGKGNPAVAVCAYEVLPYVPQANLGECVSYSIIPNKAFSTHDCDAWLEIYPDDFYANWDSYSQCVRELRDTY
jgi:hypothetical protein